MNDSLPCPAEWHSEEPDEYRERPSECQHLPTPIFLFSTSVIYSAPNTLITHQLKVKDRSRQDAELPHSAPWRAPPGPAGNLNAPIGFPRPGTGARAGALMSKAMSRSPPKPIPDLAFFRHFRTAPERQNRLMTGLGNPFRRGARTEQRRPSDRPDGVSKIRTFCEATAKKKRDARNSNRFWGNAAAADFRPLTHSLSG